MTDLEEALVAAQIIAQHHAEMVEAAAETGQDFGAEVLAAGERLDLAVLEAHAHGATLFEMWLATKLPVEYLTRLTN